MLRRRELMAHVKAELPSGYARCKYVEGNGKQYFLTDYAVKSKDTICVKATFESKDNSVLFGARDSGNYEKGVQLYLNRNPKILGIPDAFITSPILIGRGLSVEGGYSYFYNVSLGQEFEITDVSVNDVGIDTDMIRPIAVFALNSIGSIAAISKCKLFQLWIGNNLNLIPCLDNSNTPVLFDTVSQTTFHNLGTGTFGYELLDGTYVAPI